MTFQDITRFKATVLIMSCLSIPVLAPAEWSGGFVSVALADDDDDDDGGDDDDGDDDDDDDDDDRGGGRSDQRSDRNGAAERQSSKTQRRQQAIQAAPRRPAPQRIAVLPDQAPAEIVVSDVAAEDLNQLLAEGFAVIDTVGLTELNRVLTRLTPPSNLNLEAARDRVRALPSGQNADFNHFYRFEQTETPELSTAPCTHENCPAWDLIEWPHHALASGQCAVTVPVGIVDTGINPEHEIMRDAQLEVVNLSDQAHAPSKAIHGTAVASLLVGAAGSRVPGLISNAQVIAIDAFSRDGQDERADLVSLLRGLDLLVGRGVRVINLSLAGPENRLLEQSVEQMTQAHSIVLVAAAGNAGPKGLPAFPAAFDNVIAVTAVDARARVYRQAQRGAHIDLAGPGVNMLAATSIRGARLKSGTSFAVPFVTAAAAILLSKDADLTPEQVTRHLTENAKDLGAPGVDEIFGNGLVFGGGLC